ncbi:MAG: hypothetical protein WDW38_011371 [Sanguina aurantia]
MHIEIRVHAAAPSPPFLFLPAPRKCEGSDALSDTKKPTVWHPVTKQHAVERRPERSIHRGTGLTTAPYLTNPSTPTTPTQEVVIR